MTSAPKGVSTFDIFVAGSTSISISKDSGSIILYPLSFFDGVGIDTLEDNSYNFLEPTNIPFTFSHVP